MSSTIYTFPTKQVTPGLFAQDAEGIEALSWDTVGQYFPIRCERAYMNNASIGALSTPVIDAVDRFMHDVRDHGRNNYPHWCKYADDVIKARIARLIGARREEIAFVKNTTEGLVNVANGFPWREGDNVILADIEYPSNVYCWMKLAARGVSVRWVKNRQGRILVDDIRAQMDERTRMVSLSAVQFSNGFRLDVAAVAALCAERGAYLNLDAIQWAGALAMDVEALGVHFLSVGGHKWMLAPIGTGFFYCRRDVLELLDPPSVGYHSVTSTDEDHMDYVLEYRKDAGRFEEALANFTGLWGLDTAVRIQLALGSQRIEQHIMNLTGHAVEALRQKGYVIVSAQGAEERSGNLSFRHPGGVDVYAIAAQLREEGVDVAVRGGNLRMSATYFNDLADVDRMIAALPGAA